MTLRLFNYEFRLLMRHSRSRAVGKIHAENVNRLIVVSFLA